MKTIAYRFNQNLRGKIQPPPDKEAERKAFEKRLKEAEKKVADKAKTIRSKYGEGSYQEREFLGELQPFEVILNGGVKLGTINPMSVSIPNKLTGTDPLRFPIYFVPSDFGDPAGTGTIRTGKRGALDIRKDFTFDLNLVEIRFNIEESIDLQYLFENSGVPQCAAHDFETLNSENAEVRPACRLIIMPHATKLRVLKFVDFPFVRGISSVHSPNGRNFLKVLDPDEVYVNTFIARPSEQAITNIDTGSRSLLVMPDGTERITEFRTSTANIFKTWTDLYFEPEVPFRTFDTLLWTYRGALDRVGHTHLIFPSDKPAVLDLVSGGIIRLC